jgi:electron transport complex protein RnfE
MAEKKSLVQEFTKGIWLENPVLRLLLGMCPSLAVTNAVINGIGMGAAATFVLVMSNIVTAMMRNIIPSKMRIPCFIVTIAGFVTIVDLVMQGFFFHLSQALGVFVPLIVVNCIILQRAEAYAYKNGVLASAIDALGMGVGFTLALVMMGVVREFFGNGTILGFPMTPASYHPAIITLGMLIAGMNWQAQRSERLALERSRNERKAARRIA